MDSFIRDYDNPAVDTKIFRNVSEYEELKSIKKKLLEVDFSILHNNIRSISKNFDEFCVFLTQFSNDFDCIVLSETWNIPDISCFQITGYDLLYNQGNYNKSDGVVVFVKSNYNYTSSVVNIGEVSVLQVNIEQNNKKISLSALYKSPNINTEDFNVGLKTYLEHLNRADYTLFVGDINIDILTENIYSQDYLDILNEYGFTAQINKYTREQTTSKSCLDHIF